MLIGLVDVDSHATKRKWGCTIYPNIALAKIARYHRSLGHQVEWAMPFTHYDIVYESKIFSFSPSSDIAYTADKVVRGGTGYDIHSSLPDYIDRLQPDYSIYPHVPTDTAYGFLTRGCPNKCSWCVVPRKEGAVRPYMDVDEIAIEGRKNLVLMDNNFLAAGDYAVEQLNKIILRGYRIDFNQAMDARLVTDEYASLLARVKWIHSRIRFGCDTHAQIAHVDRAICLLEEKGFRGEFFLYTMLGNDFNECYNRINYFREQLVLKRAKSPLARYRSAVYAYAQPYRDPNKQNHVIPQWQKDMASWCNKRMIFFSTDFAGFSPRKGFTCSAYLTPPHT